MGYRPKIELLDDSRATNHFSYWGCALDHEVKSWKVIHCNLCTLAATFFYTGMPQTCRRNWTPVQGSAAWTGSYWTATSPTCLKRSIHLAILPNRSLKIIVSPLFLVYRHLLLMHSCFDCSVSTCRSDKMLSLSGQLKLILHLSSSLSLATASAQMSLLWFSGKMSVEASHAEGWMDLPARP